MFSGSHKAFPADRVEIKPLRHDRVGSLIAARRTFDDSLVAVRLLAPALHGDADYVYGLRRNLWRLVDRPHDTVIAVYGIEDTPEYTVVESELPDGLRLDDILLHGALPLEAALVVFLDLLDALAWLHHLGVLHTNVRPGAVVVSPEGVVRLGEPGVAMPTFKPRSAPGTPAYMAPELWNEEPPTMSTDIYAASAVAFEALTGRPPFSASRLQALRAAHLRGRIPAGDVDERVQLLFLDGLAKTAELRSPSAAAFRDTLRRVVQRALGEKWETEGRAQLASVVLRLAAATVNTKPRKPTDTTPKPRRRRAVGIVFGLIVVALTASVWIGGNGSAAPTRSTVAIPKISVSAQPSVSVPPRAAAKPSAVPTLASSPLPTASKPVVVITPTPVATPVPTPTATPTPAATPTP